MTKGDPMEWDVVEDRQYPGHWRVEAIHYKRDGEIYVAVFSGPGAQERAERYAAWQAAIQAPEP